MTTKPDEQARRSSLDPAGLRPDTANSNHRRRAGSASTAGRGRTTKASGDAFDIDRARAEEAGRLRRYYMGELDPTTLSRMPKSKRPALIALLGTTAFVESEPGECDVVRMIAHEVVKSYVDARKPAGKAWDNLTRGRSDDGGIAGLLKRGDRR